MTQAQHSDIVTLLTQKFQLIETAFIEEMTDHFVTSIENQMSDTLSFQQALEQTVKDFGGEKNIQRMEWAYRKVFLKNQFRDWWGIVKGQFSKSKLIRSVIIVGFVLIVCLYFGLTDLIGVGERQIILFALQGGSIIPIVRLIWFLLQRVIPPFKKVAVIRSPSLFSTMLLYLLGASVLLLILGVSTLDMPMLFKGLIYSALWSTLAILYLAFLDYSMKTAPDQWYPTKIADQ